MEGTELYAISDPIALCRAEMGLDDVMSEITRTIEEEGASPTEDFSTTGEDNGTSTSGENGTATPILGDGVSTQDFIRGQIQEYLQRVSPPETQVRFEELSAANRANQSDIKNGVKSLQIESEPDDVVSFHDFYDLQIAFYHVWAEVFDDDLRALGERIYSLMVERDGFEDRDEDSEPSFVSVEDLESFLLEVQEFQENVEITIDPMVISRLPLVSEELWVNLSATQKDSIVEIARKIDEWERDIWAIENQFSEAELLGMEDSGTITYEEWVRWNARRLTRNSIILGAVDPGVASAELLQADQDEIATLLVRISQKREQAREILSSVTVTPDSARRDAISRRLSRLDNLVTELNGRLKEEYKFDVFAKDSINFGLLINYRQEWKPIQYQVGDLVSTIPLAPKETKKYTKKRVVKKSRQEKEVENALQIRKDDSSTTSRINAEIIKKAKNKTNFKATAEGSGGITGVYNVSASTSLETEAERSSANTKKTFRESVVKASQEYKNEHKLEIETKASEEFETTESGEITNPNDELTVTYLFYELQRVFEISEKIHRLTPVILVANKVPAPHEIDEDWLIAHDWILRRVILDDSFLNGLDLLSESLLGNEISLAVLRTNVDLHSKIAQEVKEQVAFKESELLDITDDEERQVAENEINKLRSELTTAITAMHEATNQYTEAIRNHFDRQAEITRLRIHVKDNILYYMKAIWDHEPTDQRFFRLYNIDVPVVDPETGTFASTATEPVTSTSTSTGTMSDIGDMFTRTLESDVEAPASHISFPTRLAELGISLPPPTRISYKKLVEVADIENLLGYKGNYMIFPLKKNNYLTTYMMQPYIDEIMGRIVLRDPDNFGNLTSEELVELFRCAYVHNPDAFTEEVQEEIKDVLREKLSSPRREKEKIIVPSDSLYIEALLGSHPILEDFKLVHRAIDVKKVQADVRHAELENLRLAARLMEGEREDPDIEKKVIVQGNGTDLNVDVGGAEL